jgi:hypothetical protein
MISHHNVRYRVSAFVILMLGISIATRLVLGESFLYKRGGFATGSGPTGLIVADLNGDRRLDLAVTNFNDNTVSILLGTRNGTFATKVDYATGVSPAALVTADFRGDGNADLAIVNENAGTVSVLLGNGDGTFEAHVDYPVGSYPLGIVAADFNSDGKIDLAVVNDNDSTVSILLGNGDGTFQSQMVVSVGTEPTSLGGGDFNGDGKVDLITANVSSGTVTVLLSKGDGSFTRVDSSSGIFAPNFSALVVGDFNRDGKLDVVVSSINTQLVLLLGKGDGSLQAPAVIPSSQPDSIDSLLAADFNGDGRIDLVEEVLGGQMIVLLGNGDGTCQPPVFSSEGEGATGLASADINRDGALDLLVADPSLSTIDVLLGDGNGAFGNMKDISMAQTRYSPDAAVAADFNGDGKLDLAVAEVNFPNGQISVQLGKGNGTFGQSIVSPLISDGGNNGDLLLTGDFNGDGKPDLLLMDDYSIGFQVLLGNGDGSFQAAVDTSLSYTALSLAIGEFNGDGKADVVVTTNGSTGNPSMNIYLGNGDGTFRQGAQYTVTFYTSVAVADVNNDGKGDLVVTSFGSPLEVFLGNGDGTFQNPISGPTALYSGGMVLQDFNGNGKLDMAVVTYGGIGFLAGNGDGTFQNPVYSNSMFQFCCQMAAIDVSGDGILDLVNVDAGVGVWVMVGNGDGTFQVPMSYGASGIVYSGTLGVGDFNSDGVGDIGMANQDLYTGQTTASLYLSIPSVNLFPTALKFGAEIVGKTSSAKNIALTNTGNATLKVSSITVTGDFLETTTCGAKLPIGKSCAISVSFKPRVKGLRTGTVSIVDNAQPSPQVIHLSGTGE